jgi:MurNAc alpha-1-phosphate uridylyltransferase
MPSSLTVFFLCAGYGRRLAPLSDRIPKPLIPFQGKSALRLNREKIAALNPDRIICNTHHLHEQVRKEAEELGIEVFHEDKILGTGGCMGNCRDILAHTDYFLVHNGDIMHNIDLNDFIRKGTQCGCAGFLAGINRPAINTLVVDADGNLEGIEGDEGLIASDNSIRLTYSGIALYHKSFLKYCCSKAADIREFWTAAREAREKIIVQDCSVSSWFDFGNPQGLWEAARWYMDEADNYSYQYTSEIREPCVSNEASLPGLPEGMKNVLIYERPDKPLKREFYNRIIGRNISWEISST